ncbi:DUF2141 domain-containing protein [Pseudomonas oleovorans]|uniref:Uncharacterized protein (DUF2141 family) n=1 Tax=Ectopseudomonas oleovorans TaxID=301 RepID=A0A3D9EJZ5_ECTOL|nr:DUF2141 domain-containing protein [Pseudomonas oleovorans]RED02705.1 uncharacterized protein (DUF2141 family) [Pseudomonas oleovorans]
MKSLLLVAGLGLSGLLQAAELQVRVETVDASGGQLLLAVFDSEAAWKAHKTPVAQAHLAAQAGTQEQRFELPPGRYAVSVIHDSNGNSSLDTNFIGMPTEQYGYSNNPPLRMRMATFEECAFTLPAAGLLQKVTLR